MASFNNKTVPGSTKADAILQREGDIMRLQAELTQKQSELSAKVDRLIATVPAQTAGNSEIAKKVSQESAYLSKQNAQIYESLKQENAGLRKEFTYLYTQAESTYTKLSSEITQAVDDVSGKVAQEVTQQYGGVADEMMAKLSAELAYMSAQMTSVFDKLNKKIDDHVAVLEEKIDGIAKAVADELEARASETAEEDVEDEQLEIAEDYINYDELSTRIAEKLADTVKAPDLDYDALAQNVADRIPPQEVISADYIASRVAEQIVLPEDEEVDYEELADLIAERLAAEEEVEEVAEEEAEEPVEEVAEEEAEPVEEVAEEPAEQPEAIYVAEEEPEEVLDYDLLADKIAERIVVPSPEAAELDYDLLADKIAERVVVPAPEVAPEDAAEIDYDLIAEKIAEKLPEPAPMPEPAAEMQPAMDVDALADDIAHKVSALTNDEFGIVVDDEGCATLASAVAEKIDYDILSQKIIDRIYSVEDKEADIEPDMTEEEIADLIAEKFPMVDEDSIADKTAAAVSNYIPNLDADEIAEKVANIIAPSLNASEAPELDYEVIAEKVANLIIPELPAAPEAAKVDYDEISSRLTVIVSDVQSQLDYDIVLDSDGIRMLADAIIAELSTSNAAELDNINARLDSMIESEAQAHGAEDAKLGELGGKVDGIYGKFDDVHGKLDGVYGKFDDVHGKLDGVYGKFDDVHAKLDSIIYKEDEASQKAEAVYIEADAAKKGIGEVKADTEEILAKLAEGPVVIAAQTVSETAAASAVAEEEPEEVAEEIAEEPAEEIAEEVAEEPAEEVAEEAAEEPVEEVAEEAAEEPAEEIAEEAAEEPVEEVAEEAAEEPAEEVAEEAAEEPAEEIAEEEEEELVTVSDLVGDDDILDGDDSIADLLEDTGEEAVAKGGVDFANMMKYNRSFIARIIQSNDDVKRYYGQIKNSMLSYKKVNSSIAWGAERFNKGRETIAKLKIRGKTLCLYLNLDPNEYKVSVYHHKDVSDNKSMSGTPMMVKIKSPLGVRKAIRLVDDMLAKRNGEKRVIQERDYAAMYPYETIEELIEDGLVKDVKKN